jgi:lysozyme family protein
MDSFSHCLEFVLDELKGHGISQKTYNKWRKYHHLNLQDIKVITNTEINMLYKEFYWMPIGGNRLAPGVNLTLFDLAVDAGIHKTNNWRGKYLRHGDIKAQIDDICNQRLTFMHRMLRKHRWINAWIDHIEKCRQASIIIHNPSNQTNQLF